MFFNYNNLETFHKGMASHVVSRTIYKSHQHQRALPGLAWPGLAGEHKVDTKHQPEPAGTSRDEIIVMFSPQS